MRAVIAGFVSLLLMLSLIFPLPRAAAASDPIHLVPMPASVRVTAGCRGVAPSDVLRSVILLSSTSSLPFETVQAVVERWHALGLPRSVAAVPKRSVVIVSSAHGAPAQSYSLRIDASDVRISAADGDGLFYAFVTLAQLLQGSGSSWTLPCVAIDDRPGLAWRILSDDISRGPLPTVDYFKERIRTIASLKMNGYAPYAEHVVFDPQHPLPAPLDALTPSELRELNAFARRYHVALIPQQQTFAHMHNSLRWETYAPLAETPHGYLLSPAHPAGVAYAQDLIRNQLAAVPHPPFFHIGADEPVDLGRGQAQAIVEREGEGPVYTRFVTQMAQFVAAQGTRPLIWDDALSRHPELFAALPKSLVFVNWHYGDEPTFLPYIKRIADGGFEQMVAPGSRNWNEIYPDLNAAFANIDRFVSEGKSAHVLGLYQTVWHDDGETLFEATWVPVAYAAASAWESGSVDRARFLADFGPAFFGSDDPRYSSDINDLAAARETLRKTDNSSDYLYWADAFDARFDNRVAPLVDTVALRTAAERVLTHLRTAAPPPMHANAAAVMFLAARRYDQLGRNLQIAKEARGLYGDAAVQLAAKKDSFVERDLFLTKYLFWEQRDSFLELVPLVRAAWEYENRPSHELSVLERYHLAAQRAIVRADAVNRAVYEFVEPGRTLPAFDSILAPSLPAP